MLRHRNFPVQLIKILVSMKLAIFCGGDFDLGIICIGEHMLKEPVFRLNPAFLEGSVWSGGPSKISREPIDTNRLNAHSNNISY